MTKRLVRSGTDKMIAGVCGGLATYFGVDATLVRLAFAALILIGMGSPLLAYLVLWLIMPLDDQLDATETLSANVKEMSDKARELVQQVKKQVAPDPKNDVTKGPGDQI